MLVKLKFCILILLLEIAHGNSDKAYLTLLQCWVSKNALGMFQYLQNLNSFQTI